MIKFCNKCQIDTERYKSGACTPCHKLSAAKCHAANPGRQKARSAAWRKANPEKSKASNAKYRAANPEKVRACEANHRANNPEKVRACIAAWARANPEACRIHGHNRRAKERANGGKLSQGISVKLFKLQRGLCPCCNKPLGDDYHLDHRTPIKMGGANTDNNMQLLRAICNRQKNAKDPITFMQSRGFLI